MVKFKMRIQRFDPKQDDTPHHENFNLETEGDLNVIQAIRHIHETIEGSLAFRNTDCRRGVFGLCSMIIDGKRRLACMCVAADGMTIEPPRNRNIVKDLVFEMN